MIYAMLRCGLENITVFVWRTHVGSAIHNALGRARITRPAPPHPRSYICILASTTLTTYTALTALGTSLLLTVLGTALGTSLLRSHPFRRARLLHA